MNASPGHAIRRVVFRADASPAIGHGHVMRCLCLADALRERGVECHFVCAELPCELNERLARRGHPVHVLPPTARADEVADAAASATVVAALRAASVVVDHYQLGAAWETRLRRGGVGVMAIDDLADRHHDVDLLIDANVGRTASDYAGLVPPACRVLCGPEYALLRPEFAAARATRVARGDRPEVRRVLVSLGGTDPANVSATVLEALDASPLPRDCTLTVVLGAGSPWLDDLRRRAQAATRTTEVLAGVDDMAALMADCDLAVGAGGVIALERCCLGLPSVIVVLAANQRPGSAALQRAGAAVTLAQTESIAQTLPPAIAAVLPAEARAAMARRAAQWVDGLGCARVADAVRASGSQRP